MPLDTPVTLVSPAKPAASHASQRQAQPQIQTQTEGSAAKASFAQMLHGQQNRKADFQRQTADHGAAPQASEHRRGEAKPSKEAKSSEAGDGDSAKQAAASSPQEDAPKKTALSAEDLPAQPSTLQLAGKRGDESPRGLDALKARLGGAAAHARRAGEGGGKGQAADAGAADAGFRSSLQAAAKAAGADASEAQALSLTAATAPASEAERSRESDGSLPSLSGLTELASPRHAALPTGAEAAATARADLPVPPDSPAFPQALGVQLSTWMDGGVEHAMLELHPQDLGPIEVRIAVHEGATRIELGSEVASTRAALHEALPQLAEQLGDVGLSLLGGSVSDQTGQGSARQDGQPAGSGGAGRLAGGGAASGRLAGDEALGGLPGAAPRPVVSRRGLLDMYA